MKIIINNDDNVSISKVIYAVNDYLGKSAYIPRVGSKHYENEKISITHKSGDKHLYIEITQAKIVCDN